MCTFTWSFDQDLALWTSCGVRHVGLLITKLAGEAEERLARLSAAGIGISTLIVGGFDLADPATWDATRAAQRRAIDMVAAHGGHSIYFTSGRTVRFDWDEDLALLAEAVAPTVDHARGRGVIAAIEPTSRSSASFVSRLADAVDVAGATGLGIVADIANLWTERGLAATLRRARPHLALVQIGDVAIGSSTRPAAGGRVHVGKGELPLGRMIRQVLDGGYDGLFDLEVVTADFTAPPDEAALRDGIAAASDLLASAGI